MTDNTALQSYLEAIPLPAVFVGQDARIQGANKGAGVLNARALTQSVQRPFVLAFRQPALTQALDDCLHSKSQHRAVFHDTEGSNPVRYDVLLSYVDGHDFRGVLVCFTDVTHATKVDKMRREFVANVSHELRSPLTAISGFIETLQGPAKDDKSARTRFLDMMGAEAARMNRLVGDLLSLSRVEDNARRRPTDQQDMGALISSVVENLTGMAVECAGTIVFQPPSDPVLLPADADQIRQVFTNLIENALKYGGQGTKVTVSIRNIPRDRVLRGPAVAFDVQDTGPGIDPYYIPRLTERFYRIDSHRSREMGGTGLGLAIVKHILNRHRGHLDIESTPGEGSTFSVILPKS